MKPVDLSGLDPELEPDAEKLHRLARIGINSIPIAGGTLLEIFNSVLESPLNKRRTETMLQIGDVMNKLIEQRIVTEVGLQQNEAFISTVSEVCAISLRNHQSEKLEALRNAVRNSALPSCPSDDYRQMFLNFVDRSTVTHIRMLRFADDPAGWFKSTNTQFPGYKLGDISGVVDAALPELIGHARLREATWDELWSRGLISPHLNLDSKGPDDTFERLTTDMGADLVRFIG